MTTGEDAREFGARAAEAAAAWAVAVAVAADLGRAMAGERVFLWEREGGRWEVMEDIDYLVAHGEKKSFQFLVDSRNRDKTVFPTPAEYVIPFSTPFTNVIAVDVLEASVPRTGYNVDDASRNLTVSALRASDGTWEPPHHVALPTGDYDVLTLCETLGGALSAALAPATVTVAPTSMPPEVKSTLTFRGSAPFALGFGVAADASEVLGFDAPATATAAAGSGGGFACVDARTFASVPQSDGTHAIAAPGIYSLVGDRYVLLRCAEVETPRDALSEAYAPGIAKFTLGVVGYASSSLDFANGGVREFHPVGRLSRLTLRFERPDGTLYNFRGVNHTLTLVVRYLAPKREGVFERSSLNPNFDGNYLGWQRTDEEREGDSDDETEAFNASVRPLGQALRAEAVARPENQAARRAEQVRQLFS